MTYKTFSLKWRPQTFDEVIGQEHITTTLKNAIKQKRIANAYLFTGPRGTGKTSSARILAKSLNCKEGVTPNPCNKCENCIGITRSNSLDVLEIDGASNRGIDEIRNLRENVKLSASGSKYKIYIIDEVHMLTEPAFNALLKTLEEPPSHVKFIFATTQPQKILPTIISRCQRFDFRRIPVKDIINKLKEITKEEKLKIDEEAIYLIAKSADGALRDAELILDQVSSASSKKMTVDDINSIIGSVGQQFIFGITDRIIKKDTKGALNLFNGMIDKGKDLSIFVSELIEHFRNLMVAKEVSNYKELIDAPEDNLKKIKEQEEHFSKEDLLYIFSLLSKVQYEMRNYPMARIPLEVVLIKLTREGDLVNVGNLLEKLKDLEKKLKGYPGGEVSEENVSPRVETPLKEEAPVKEDKDIKEEEVKSNALVNEDFNQDEFRDVWDKACRMIKEAKTPVGLYICEGTPLNLKKNMLTIGFYPGFSFHKESLEGKKNKKLVEKTFSELLKKKIKIQFIDITSKTSSVIFKLKKKEDINEHPQETTEQTEKEKKVNPIITSAVKLFGGLLVKGEGKELSS